MLLLLSLQTKSFRRSSFRRLSLFQSLAYSTESDILVTALNSDQDITVKAVSAKNVVQECIKRLKTSDQAAYALGEILTCSLLMASGIKGEETLQINLVGNRGIRNIVTIVDGELKIRLDSST